MVYPHRTFCRRWQNNIIFNRVAGGRAPTRSEIPAEGVVSYEYI